VSESESGSASFLQIFPDFLQILFSFLTTGRLKGWEIGIASMRIGELAVLTIGPAYAYGDEAPPDSPIPKGATLTFEVELLAFDLRRDVSLARNKSLLLRTVNWDQLPPADAPGAPPNAAARKPATDDSVVVAYELRQVLALPDQDRVLDAPRRLEFVIGEDGVPPALEHAVLQMQAGERGVVDVVRGVAATALLPPPPNEFKLCDALPAEWRDGERAVAAERAALDAAEKDVQRRPNWVRPYNDDDVVARIYVTLVSIASPKYGFELGPAEKIAEANAAKARGAALFAQGRLEQAKKKFKRAVGLVEQQRNAAADGDDDDAGARQASEIALSCHLNVAACQLKLKEFTAVLESTNHALKIDEQNVKALFRRAQALIQLHRWDEADELLAAAIRIEPSNAAVRDEIKAMKARRQEHAAKERKVFANMFDRMADQEASERKQRLLEAQKAK
jgi:FK506-binding protein 4/5